MASYTDRTPQFNPYVSQLPVDAMVKVGMEKQQQYNQGIQKIQTQIDEVAGLDIIRDSDKQYLQSRLNDLGNNLKTVAAADFSNMQITNSTAGMAAKIGKDPIIQNSVISTQRVRKAMAERDNANREGKGSVENDWWLDKNINQYLNSSDEKASFNTNYLQYRDIKPKMLEVLKSLHESGKDEQVPWETNSDGTLNYGKTAAAMVEKGRKGVTSGQIENAIRASFDQNDLRQMEISGQYQFRNFTPEDLVMHAKTQYDRGIDTVKSKIEYLQKFAESHKDPKQVSQYNEAMSTIKELQNSIGENGDFKNKLKSQLDATLQGIAINPEAVKAEIYKNGLVKEFANAHSWEESSTKYLSNPYLEAEHWEKKFGVDLAMAKSTIAHQRFTEDMARANLGISQRELELKEKAATGGAGFVTTGGLSQVDENPQTKIVNEVTSLKASADAQLVDLADRVSTSMINNGADPSTRVSVPELQAMIAKGQLGPEFQSSVNKYKQTLADAGDKNAAYNSAKLAVENDPAIKAINISLEQMVSQYDPVTISSKGQSLTFSPVEVIDYVNKVNRIFSNATRSSNYGTSIDTSMLSPKEKLLFDHDKSGKVRDDYREVVQRFGDAREDYNKKLDAEILKRVPNYVPKEVSLGYTSEKKNEWNMKTVQLLGRVTDADAGNYGLNKDTLAEWLTADKTKGDLEYGVIHTGADKWLVIRNGTESQRIRLLDKESAQIPEAFTSPSAKMQDILVQRGGTTNFMKGDPEGARYTNFPNVKKYKVGVDATSDPNDPTTVYPKIYVKTADGWKTLLYKEPMTGANAITSFNKLNDSYILEQVKLQLPEYANKLVTQ